MFLSPKLLQCLCLFFVSTLWHLSWAQSSVSISFLRDNEVNSFDKEIQSEIEQLLSETYTLSFQTYDFSDLLTMTMRTCAISYMNDDGNQSNRQ